MHMADAFLSPQVGLGLWAAAGGLIAWAARGVRRSGDDRLVPLMGVLGAFVFAAQMINFAIPGTGSSGHLAGGLLLAILVGPHAAVLVMASVLLGFYLVNAFSNGLGFVLGFEDWLEWSIIDDIKPGVILWLTAIPSIYMARDQKWRQG